ncbi:MAG: DMT family transporter [Legionellaceae bacterium]|nr:DMT family transporter [Legionellaceae bacterium]
MKTETNPMRGMAFCLLSYFFISLIGLFEKSISHDISIPVIMFFQSTVCVLLSVFSLFKNNIKSLKPLQPLDYLIRISSGAACYVTLFYIIRFIPISEAMLYQYSASLWIPFIMSIWLKVRMRNALWIGILVGFAGLILILKPNQSMLNVVSLVGILCGIFQAISVVAVRKLSTEPRSRVMFYNFFVVMIVSSFFAIKYWTPLNLSDFLLLCCVGITTYIGQTIFSYACNFAHPTTLAPLCYTSILYSGLIGWVVWRELPDTQAEIGIVLVVLGCVLTVLMNRKAGKVPAELVVT